MQTPPPSHSPSGFAELYRFAVLLTGQTRMADQILTDTLAEAAAHLDQVRSETGRQAWLVQAIREQCLKLNGTTAPAAPRLLRHEPSANTEPAVLKIEAFLLAQRFHTLPEPERSALAIFYLDFFTIAEIAELLKMNVETLSDTLASARELLAQALRAPHDDLPPA